MPVNTNERENMKFNIYQVDAFADSVFSGNPAAVCAIGSEWLPESIMQSIAAENNLAETAFFILKDGKYTIRWFTPETEVDLCGHATLATAHVLFHHQRSTLEEITFQSRSGELRVRMVEGKYRLDFPVDVVSQVDITPELLAGFDQRPIEAYRGKTDYLLVFASEKEIRNMKVDFSAVKKVAARGIIVTAPGEHTDFVSRFFAPQVGIDEDPVTGSAHTTLAPIWAKKHRKTILSAAQLSKRGGKLWCELVGDRVHILGNSVTFLTGEVEI